MPQVDPRVQGVPAMEADRVARIIRQMKEQGSFQELGDPAIDTATQEGLGQGLDPRFLDITPDQHAVEAQGPRWDDHTRMGGERANYALATNHPAIVGATDPTPDMLVGPAEDVEKWRNTRHFPG